jgi:hypothetical protein
LIYKIIIFTYLLATFYKSYFMVIVIFFLHNFWIAYKKINLPYINLIIMNIK